MSLELPDDIYEKVKGLCAKGDAFARISDFAAAKEQYIEALRLLPGDHRDWDAATWIYVAIGDGHFHMGNFEKSFRCFWNAVQCPDGLGNPFIHLRLGQAYFEAGELDKAADELTRAYMGGGLDILLEDDPKYLEFLQTKIEI